MERFLIRSVLYINMKTYKVIVENTPVTGTAEVIINILREKSLLYTQLSSEEFIKEIQRNIWKLFGIGINIDISLTYEEQCESLVDQLIHHKLLPSQ